MVGVVPPDLPLTPHEHEVAEVFEVPLAYLADLTRYRRGERVFDGRTFGFHEIHWGERRIWGITAALLVNLARRLAPAP